MAWETRGRSEVPLEFTFMADRLGYWDSLSAVSLGAAPWQWHDVLLALTYDRWFVLFGSIAREGSGYAHSLTVCHVMASLRGNC